MKLTLDEVYNIHAGLNELLDKELATSVAFTVQKNYMKVAEEVKAAEKVRGKLLEKHKKEKNGHVEVKPEFYKEVEELLQQEVQVKLKPIKLSDMGDAIKPKALVLLEKILEPEDEA